MALPLPGSPSASWATFGERLKHVFSGADPRVCVAFWLLGLVNNVICVVILSAALDLVGPSVPKGVVLLAEIVPALIAKLLTPYFIQAIPYNVRVVSFVFLSGAGMLLVALTPDYTDGGTITAKMIGVMLASLSSGVGELSFVGLVHYYGPFSLAAWGSGTGGAGLLGAGAYALATTTWGLSVRTTLLASACLPAIMVVSFFVILPRGPLKAGSQTKNMAAISSTDSIEGGEEEETEGLLGPADGTDAPKHAVSRSEDSHVLANFTHNLSRARSLFFPYILPLLLVYIAEYTINQGVSPTLLFPLDKTPFKHYRAFYPTYGAIYQCGVFLSRSSTPFFRVHNLYIPMFLQVLNLVLLTLHSMYDFIPSVYIVFLIIFWEGLLGGLLYVNTFAKIIDEVDKKDREFSLSATTVSDSGGICIAGFISMAMEVSLCNRQVARGRNWCKQL